MDFVDPYTKQPLKADEEGNLYSEDAGGRRVYANYDGCYDFAAPRTEEPGERQYYDSFYDSLYEDARPPRITIEAIRYHWMDDTRPENLALLESLGKIEGKKILLLGNGTSAMELYLLCGGAEVVYTDLSIRAIRLARDVFQESELKEKGFDKIEFHAADALNLPFPDNTFDIIYGFAFVHHVPDVDSFFGEVRRCLKEGGICRFLDGAYSPLWQFSKGTYLKPLQRYIHKKRGISPEDLKATERGGYREAEIKALMEKYGFRDLLFLRVSFFLWIARRGLAKFMSWNPKVFRRARPFLLCMKGLDKLGEVTGILKSNFIALVWGFTK
jgi:ubiquinone/menaquinone biosynthesis C-methylase UbiE